MSLNLKFEPHVTYNTTKQVQDFIQASTVHSEILFNTVVATVTQGLSHTILSPPCETCVSLKCKFFHATKENIQLKQKVA
jgi:hypothetical protein